ncbi:MAG: flagellar motor protein MotB [Rhodospirillaceae bacterium]
MAERPDFGGAGSEKGITIVKRIKKGEHASHGGAWKVAYADFVTAMMAFFLLLWLLNAVTEQQLNGVADYFTPIAASTRESGAGGMLGGQTIGEGASQSQTGSTAAVVLPPPSIGSGGQDMTDPKESPQENAEEAVRAAQEAKDQKEFQQVTQELKDTISGVPDLAPLASSLLVDQTPEGVRIQVMDQDKIDMFSPGSANLFPRSKELLANIAKVIRKMPNKISITGHTDPSTAVDPQGYTNWELSSDRALATRRALLEGGLDDRQINKVTGVSDREPVDTKQPRSPRNRRVSIVLLRAENAKGDEFDRLPNFLEKGGAPPPLVPALGETLQPAPKP